MGAKRNLGLGGVTERCHASGSLRAASNDGFERRLLEAVSDANVKKAGLNSWFCGSFDRQSSPLL